MKLDQITKDDDIYPRLQISHKAIESYGEALNAGAKFPPILVQKIKENSHEKTIVLDGLHRLEACRKVGHNEIEVVRWKDEVLDKREWLERLRILSLKCNRTHGDRAGENDLRFQSLRIANDRPIEKLASIIKELASEFGVTEGYMSQLIGPDVNRRKQSRDALAYRLHLLGWTQEEIGKVIGLSRSGVEMIDKNFNTKLFVSEYESGLAPEQIATNHNLDEALVWAILLKGKDDIKRFYLFGKEAYGDKHPRLSDYWVFNKGDPRLGKSDYEGRLFGQQVMNILYSYSKQGDLVIDPMAGGGVTVDTCLVMNRKCRAYDIRPEESGRKDIEQHDAREEFPERARNCDLIILDPPYYKKKEKEYRCEGLTESREAFIGNTRKVALSCFNALKNRGYLAFIFGQYIDYDKNEGSILGPQLYELFKEVAFKIILKIQTPLSFDTQWHGDAINKAKTYDPWRRLPVSRDWYIFQKVTVK